MSRNLQGVARLLGLSALLIAGGHATAAEPADVAPKAAAPLARPQAGYERVNVGLVEVIALSDGTAPVGLHDGLVLDAGTGEVDRLLSHFYQSSPVQMSVNAYLLRTQGRTVLIDVGAGSLIGPTADKLPMSLAAAGVKPEDVTDIFLTHIHPDHVGGLLVDGQRVYPNATIHVNRKESAYWLDSSNAPRARASTRAFFSAVAMLQPYIDAGRFEAFDESTPFFPGFHAAPAYGHTPGHSFYILESQGEKLVFWGDVVHITGVQFDDPDIGVNFDSDPVQARATRRAAFADAARNGFLVAGGHLDYPGIGRLRLEHGHYRWIPVVYSNDSVAK